MSELSPNFTCPLCQGDLGSGDIVSIGEKGANMINKACVERGDDIHLTAGTGVQSYTNKNLIYKHNKTKCVATPLAREVYESRENLYDSTKDCLFCGNKVETSKVSFDYDHYSCVRTIDINIYPLSRTRLTRPYQLTYDTGTSPQSSDSQSAVGNVAGQCLYRGGCVSSDHHLYRSIHKHAAN